MITMYAMSNIDSALWGTRSVGNVKSAANSAITDAGNITGDMEETTAEPPRWINTGGGPAAPTAAQADEEKPVPHERRDSDALGVPGGGGCRRQAEWETHVRRGRKGAEDKKNAGWSLRTCKFVILASWILVNVGVTAAILWWRVYALALLGFFGQAAGMTVFGVAARVETRLQRRSALATAKASSAC